MTPAFQTNSVAPEPEDSSLHSHKLATGPCREPNESNPHPQSTSPRSVLIPSTALETVYFYNVIILTKDRLQRNNFTHYNFPSSETFTLRLSSVLRRHYTLCRFRLKCLFLSSPHAVWFSFCFRTTTMSSFQR
jgi:hypothetical protein